MAIGESRSLSSLENSASTARVLNLRKVFSDFNEDPAYQKAPFFKNPLLNRSLIVKHRLRGNERDDFVVVRNVATKLIIPIDTTDLKVGAHYVFVGQKNFEKMLLTSFDINAKELQKDFETLNVLDAIPTLDPFLLREQLLRHGIKPASFYFQITEADVSRMLTFAEAEISELVRMAVGNHGTAEQVGNLTKKLLSSNGAVETEALRLTLQMDHAQYREGIFCWKAFLYYKWQIRELLPKAKKILDEIEVIVPKGTPSNDENDQIAEMRRNISRNFARAVKSVSTTLSIYDNAYFMLTQKSDPIVFRNFLLTAPDLFKALGERLGAVEHLLSFWRFRVPVGSRTLMSAEEMIDIFGDFESSLDVVNIQDNPAAAQFDLNIKL
ncbi:MAG: hypothetical protein RJA87_857 [Pseudomonadota bacterium]|jgi:hypothetical protein